MACAASNGRVPYRSVCLSDKQTRGMDKSQQSFQPVDRRKVYEQVAEQLLAQIGNRHLRPGDALPSERELTESFGVGRSSVREALRMLESQGVIASENGGTFVVAEAAQPLNSSLRLMFALDDRTGVHDLFELRKIIDCEAAAIAAERHTPEHVAVLDAATDDMAAALAANGRDERFIEADLRFHRQVLATSGNSMLLRVWRTLEPALWSLQVVSNAMYAGDWGLMARRHLDLIEVLNGTDPEDSARLFAAHARGESSITRPAGHHD